MLSQTARRRKRHSQVRACMVVFFDFMDGTNIAPGDGHMQSVKFTFVDEDHHYEDWGYNDNGKITVAHFEFHRKKA